MLRELERRLADVLGAGLTGPAAGAVDVAPGAAESQVIVSVRHAQPAPRDFLASRTERVPGADAARRIVRLSCDVRLDVRQRQGQTRGDQIAVFDSLLYFVDAPDIRSGRALEGGDPDPGFSLSALALRECDPPASVGLDAEGFFWPVGAAGQIGDPIERIHTRLVVEPLRFDPGLPRVIAGGGQLDLAVRIGSAGAMDIRRDGVDRTPFGDVVLRLTDAGGRPGGGALAGGTAGPGGSRRVTLTDGVAAFQYTPPAQPVVDLLHVSFDDGEGDAGDEIGQLPISVRSA